MEKYCPKCFQRFPGTAERCSLDGSVLASQSDRELTGQLVDGRYTALEKIGQGGMGEVYRAEQRLVGRVVALKVLRRELAQDDSAVRRFMTEARVIASLSSRNTVTLHDVGVTQDGRLYYTMELLKGRPLSEVIASEAPLDAVRAAKLVCQVCDSLEEAHGLGVLHRDLKPDNLFVVDERGREVVKVLDFGIAKLMGDAAGETVTRTGMIVGTPQYLSPEQALGTPLGPASDLYSLATVFYEMLVGLPPFQADTPMKTVWAHLREPVPEVSRRNPHVRVPEGIERFLRRALDKESAGRYPNAAAFREGLREVLGDCVAGSRMVSLGLEKEPVLEARRVTDAQRERAREHIRRQTLAGHKPLVVEAGEEVVTASMEATDGPTSTQGYPFRETHPLILVERGTYGGGTQVPLSDPVLKSAAPAAESGVSPAGTGSVSQELGAETREMLASHRRSGRRVWLGVASVLVLALLALLLRPWEGDESGGGSRLVQKEAASSAVPESGTSLEKRGVADPVPEGGTEGSVTERAVDTPPATALGENPALGAVPSGVVLAPAEPVVLAGGGADEGVPKESELEGSGVKAGAPASDPAVWQEKVTRAKKAMAGGQYDEAMYLLAKALKAGAPESELTPLKRECYRRSREVLEREEEERRKAAEAEELRVRQEAEKAEAERLAGEKAAAERARLELEARERAAAALAAEKVRLEREAKGKAALARGLEAREGRRWKECVSNLEAAVAAGVVDSGVQAALKFCREQLRYE